MLRFRRHWWAALDHEFTPDGFCDDQTYDRLPSLPTHLFTGDFDWLHAEAAGSDAYYMQPCPAERSALHAVDRRLMRSGAQLPASFVTVMTSARLQARVPSSTSDGWTMSRPAPSPVEERGFLLSFMHSQQGNWWYYLYVAADGSCPVLGSAEPFASDNGWDEDEDREAEVVWTAAEFLEAATWMAPDFEHFLYRYWVENVIWFHLVHHERPIADLPDRAQEYLTLLHAPDRPALDIWPAPLHHRGDNPDQLKLW